MNVQVRIKEIEKQLATLPAGRLTYKNIKGKLQPYLQWTENGKEITKYVKVAERETVLNQIALRDSLLAELQELKEKYPDESKPSAYHTNAIFGEALKDTAASVAKYNKRDLFKSLWKFLQGNFFGKVCLLYGLRRTGKTTLLMQAINELSDEEFEKAVYIKANPSVTMADMNKDMQALYDAGFKYVFLDEVTLIKDFIDSAALFSDIYAAMGMKIVLSGTDSLGFWFTLGAELYDRAITLHTTFIPFREFSRLLNINDIDEYIRYGGTLKAGETDFDDEDALEADASFRDDESTRRYIDTAICQNIQHSLNCCKDGRYFKHLQDLYDEGELTGAINRIIESMNHQFLLKILLSPFKSHDLGSAAEVLRKQSDPEKRSTILDEIDRDAVTKRLMDILQIKNQESINVGISKVHVQEIEEYLKALDLVVDCPRETYLTDAEPLEYVLFTQPGMRFCQAQALVHVLMKDEVFANTSEREKTLVCNRILEEVSGRMMEDIVLLETVRTLPKRKRAFKLTMGRSEFDMVIYDSDTDSCELYEIKHSVQIVDKQYSVLTDAEECSRVEKKYGQILRKHVLYRGNAAVLENGVAYENVEQYLKSIG